MSTITREFTKEQLQQIIETDHVQCGEASALARIALASLEAEPVCVIDQSNLDYLKSGADADVWPASRAEMGDVLLYRSATPAPVSVPAAMEMDDDFDSAFEHGKAVGWNAYRAAMLQGAVGNSPVIPDAYDIEAFGIFSATEGENGLMLQIERFRFGTEKCPQIGKENMVPKFALQGVINRLQEHCDSMGNEALVDILSTPAAPQQEVKP